MKRITVNTANTYDVWVGSGLIDRAGEYLRGVIGNSRIAVISDSNVWPLYGEKLERSLVDNGYPEIPTFIFPAGEHSKNGETYLCILEFLAENRLTRNDCIIALGGGVVGDLTGFAAATYLRGIRYIQIPTTLLAAVDSSVGGKTGIDLRGGKNLAGSFYQPSLVLCDTDTIAKLPAGILRTGCAEVIKYGILYDEALFTHLETHGIDFDAELVITRCIELKRDAVVADEFDRGLRQKLNFGHTIGHAIEALSDYTVSHGEAVSIGMAMICRAAIKYDLPVCAADRVLSILEKFGLPINTDCTADAIYAAALSDKKSSGYSVNLIIPKAIGDCKIVAIPVTDLKVIIEEGY